MILKEYVMNFDNFSTLNEEDTNTAPENFDGDSNFNLFEMEVEDEDDGEDEDEVVKEGLELLDEIFEEYTEINEEIVSVFESSVHEDLMTLNESEEVLSSNWVGEVFESILEAETVADLDYILEQVEDFEFTELHEAADTDKTKDKKSGIIQKIKDLIAKKKKKMLMGNQKFKDKILSISGDDKLSSAEKNKKKKRLLDLGKKKTSFFKLAIANLTAKIRKLVGKGPKTFLGKNKGTKKTAKSK